jgi:hypothetical protein
VTKKLPIYRWLFEGGLFMETSKYVMACLNVIRKLTHKTEDISAMENELLENLHCQKTA